MPGATEDKDDKKNKNQQTENEDLESDDEGGADDQDEGEEGDDGGQGAADDEGKEKGKKAAKKKGDDLDLESLDPKVKKLIKNLRTENAKHRTVNKQLSDSHGKLKKSLIEAGVIESDEEPAEEKVKKLTEVTDQATFNNAILSAAIENNVGKGELKYFKFLVNERMEMLEEGEELTDDDLSELAQEAKTKMGGGNSGKRKSTSVGGGKNGSGKENAPDPDEDGGVTLEQFTQMSMAEKVKLYSSNRALYDRYVKEAKEKRLLVR